MPDKPSPTDQFLELSASLWREALQKTFELGTATLNASSQLHTAALNANYELGVAALKVTSTLFPSADRFRLEDAPVGILQMDEYLKVLYANPAVHNLIGATVALGTTLDRVLPFDNPTLLRQRISDSLSDNGSFTTTVELSPDAADAVLPIPIRVHIEPFTSPVGPPAGLVATLTRLPLSNLRLISDTRADLLDVCARQEPEAVLRAVLSKLHEIVPFDIATYYEHAVATDDEATGNDPESSSSIRRVRFAFDPQRPDFEWPMRWLSVPKVIDAWSREPRPFIDDMQSFIAQLPPASADYLQQHLSVQAAMREGLQSFFYFPLWEGKDIVSALSFASRTPRRFSRLHWDALDAIGLSQILGLIRASYERSFRRRVADLFQSHTAPMQLAGDFVREIAEEFGWDYVGVFRVVRVLDHFRVVAQYDSTGKLTIDESYLQPLDQGVLGAVLRRKQPIRISDVDSDEGRRVGYIKLGENKSCLCSCLSG